MLFSPDWHIEFYIGIGEVIGKLGDQGLVKASDNYSYLYASE